MSANLDLTPWRWNVDRDPEPARFRGLTPVSGWFAVYGWVDQEAGGVKLWWEPVACWAIRCGAKDGDDEVVAIVRWEGGPDLAIAEGHDRPLGLHTESEQHDETILARLRDEARKKHEREQDEQAQREQEQATVFGFVKAQPDPAAFAARMRAAGAKSLAHACLAITLAAGDAARAVSLAQRSYTELVTAQRRQQTGQVPGAA